MDPNPNLASARFIWYMDPNQNLTSTRFKDPVITGLGPSGLATATSAHEQNVPFDIVHEVDSYLASLCPNWTYDGLQLNLLPKQIYRLPKMTFPETEKNQTEVEYIFRWLEVATRENAEKMIHGSVEYGSKKLILPHRQHWSQLKTRLCGTKEDKNPLVIATSSDKEILIIKMKLFQLLTKCMSGNVKERMRIVIQDLEKILHQIYTYVPDSIFPNILASQPDSDVRVIDCLNPITREQNLYAFWKKKKVVPKSLKKSQWLKIMGPVKDQGHHVVCWAIVVAELVSAVRYIKGRDKVKIDYSSQDLIDFSNPEERSQQKSTGHYCYEWCLDFCLEHVAKSGIQREEARPFRVNCTKDVPLRSCSNLGYISKAVLLPTIEDALVVLHDHPVASIIPIFSPDYEQIKNKIYFGPTSRSSTFTGMHGVNIIGAGEENGEKYVLVRSSHGKRLGSNGNLKVSIEIMMVCLTARNSSENVFYTHPKPLIGEFIFPKLLSTKKENIRKKNDACSGFKLMDNVV